MTAENKKRFTIIHWIWGSILVALVLVYINSPEVLSPKAIVDFISPFQGSALVIYTLITLIRGFFLIPSTPFVIGGALIFPDQLLLVLVISMLGVLFSATLLYFFSSSLGMAEKFERRYPTKTNHWKLLLKRPSSTFVVLGWSFFPLVPTDLICYVAGLVKMPFQNMIFGVFVGELVLDVIYIYFGGDFFFSLS